MLIRLTGPPLLGGWSRSHPGLPGILALPPPTGNAGECATVPHRPAEQPVEALTCGFFVRPRAGSARRGAAATLQRRCRPAAQRPAGTRPPPRPAGPPPPPRAPRAGAPPPAQGPPAPRPA